MKSYQFKTLVVVGLVLLAALVIYGIKTDCPNTAGYVKCGGITL